MDANLIIFAVTSLVLGAGAGFFLGRFTSGVILYLLWAALAGSLLILLVAPLGRALGLAQDDWSRALYLYTSGIYLGPVLAASGLGGWAGLRARSRHLAKEDGDD